MSQHQPTGAPAPRRMPTGPGLVAVDALRETLRDRALQQFARNDYAGFRRWISDTYPFWRGSPTGRFLYALALTYESERSPAGPALSDALSSAKEHLAESVRSWERALSTCDLVDRDTTLVFTSIRLLEAWIMHIGGSRNEAYESVLSRMHAILASRVWETRDPELMYCVFEYQLMFALKDGNRAAANHAILQFSRILPGWASQRAFVDAIERRTDLRAVKTLPAWCLALADAHSDDTGSCANRSVMPEQELQSIAGIPA